MLKTYAKKRDFKKTPEPSGKEKAAARGALKFVIQKHSASHLHYDFRLECNGVLLSWAVPKGPSLDPATKRLAMMVEDHPIAYGAFEGIIPAGQYGGGEVIVWDNGTYCPDTALDTRMSRGDQQKEMMQGLKEGKLAFTLYGKKLHGSWTLVKTKRGERDWLLIKHKDDYVDTEHEITDNEKSVLSKKTIASLEKINPDKKNVKEKKSVPAAVVKKKSVKKPPVKKGTVRTFPEYKPMLASLAAEPFSSSGWIYEPKFDGIRAIAYISGGTVNLRSRKGIDLNKRFPALVEALGRNEDCVLDGEIVALDENGLPSFHLLQARATASNQPARAKNIVFYVFDILHDSSEELINAPLIERKKLLKKTLVTTTSVKFVDDLKCDGETAFKVCIEKSLEGIVAKRGDASYQSGRRSPDWMKVKGTQSAEFVIGGYTTGTGSRTSTFGSLLLGQMKKGKLVYAGGVGTGFDSQSLAFLLKKLKPLITRTSPFGEMIKDKGKPVWVKPQLIAEIKYHEITVDGRLRAPVFLRLRDDIKPAETGPLKEIKPPAMSSSMTRSIKMSKSDKTADTTGDTDAISSVLAAAGESCKLDVDGHIISFSHLDKALWPGKGKKPITKRDFAQYLLAVSPYILPHLKNRPLTLVRFPNGVDGQRFFQKHWDQNLPEFVETVDHFAEHAKEDHSFLLCNNLPTLLWLAQIADLELHTSHARIGAAEENKKLTQKYSGSVENIEKSTLNYPDYLVLDLDPYIYSGKESKGEEPALNRKGFKRATKLALSLKEMLADIKMEAFVKTSGRTGLHIYVPMVRNIDYDRVRAVAETLGKQLLAQYPDDVTMDWAVVKRTGKIFFDHNMNARGKTLASIYSTRMSKIATVSTPVTWDELEDIYPDDFTIATVPRRLAEIGDLWQDILDHKADLKALTRG